jgi:hypothetical protein
LNLSLLCYMHHLYLPPYFCHSNIWWRVQIMKVFIMQFSPVPSLSLSLS